MKYKPYAYLIGWSKLNIWYYGAEYGQKTKIANPSNLWTTYFTSSKEVQITIEYCGNPDVIEIRKVFSDRNKCILWEHKVLRRLNASQNPKWLNKTDNISFYNYTEHSTETKRKIAKKAIGRKRTNTRSPAFLAAVINNLKCIRITAKPIGFGQGEKNSMFGKKHSEEAKKKMSETKAKNKLLRMAGK